ncbi:MAG: hypothetical protein OWS03_08830 [Alicyclobacillaceae bacterium]|nr:hypothetical protein [Alicyclobacillaceae bacterium]
MQTPLRQANWLDAEAVASRGLFTFLLLFTLTGMDIMSRPADQQAEATKGWVLWGVVFILLAFFIIAPEQERATAQTTKKIR